MDLNDSNERKLLKKRMHEEFLHEVRLRQTIMGLLEYSDTAKGTGEEDMDTAFKRAGELTELVHLLVESNAIAARIYKDLGKEIKYKFSVEASKDSFGFVSLGHE